MKHIGHWPNDVIVVRTEISIVTYFKLLSNLKLPAFKQFFYDFKNDKTTINFWISEENLLVINI